MRAVFGDIPEPLSPPEKARSSSPWPSFRIPWKVIQVLEMDSCPATWGAHTHLTRGSGLWGERVGGSLANNNGLLNHFPKSLNSEKRACKKFQPGVAMSVLTSKNAIEILGHVLLHSIRSLVKKQASLGGNEGAGALNITETPMDIDAQVAESCKVVSATYGLFKDNAAQEGWLMSESLLNPGRARLLTCN